jgi:hypothetical protein
MLHINAIIKLCLISNLHMFICVFLVLSWLWFQLLQRINAMGRSWAHKKASLFILPLNSDGSLVIQSISFMSHNNGVMGRTCCASKLKVKKFSLDDRVVWVAPLPCKPTSVTFARSIPYLVWLWPPSWRPLTLDLVFQTLISKGCYNYIIIIELNEPTYDPLHNLPTIDSISLQMHNKYHLAIINFKSKKCT